MSRASFRSAAFLLVAFAVQGASAGLLTTSTHYNVFTFGNYTQSNVDVTGRLAAQGNVTVSGFGVGSALGSNGGDNLVVGGNLTFTNGSVNHGGVRVGGAASVSGFGLSNGTIYYDHAGASPPPSWIPHVQVAGGGIAATFFSSAQTYANTLSDNLAAKANTGSVTINPYGQISLQGVGTGLNVFNLTVAQFNGATGQGINIKANEDATVVINIVGAGASIVTASNFSFNLSGGLKRNHVVYNFSGVSSINTANLGWQGSILAPRAIYNGTYGAIDGDLVSAGVTGTTEFHEVEFKGNLASALQGPTPSSAVPEPTTLAGAALGAAAFVWMRRRRSR